MTYSCAYWQEAVDLDAAQFAKRARKTHEETPRRKFFLGLYAGRESFGIRFLTNVKVQLTFESKIFNTEGHRVMLRLWFLRR